jgi:curved DNA-binding protein CbpA
MTDRLDQLDYYTLLGLEPGADDAAMKKAFHAFALRYHPDRFVDAPEEKKARAAQIYRRGAEGYRVLCDREKRKAYDAALHEGKLRLSLSERPQRPSRPGVPAAGGSTPAGAPEIAAKARPFVEKADQAIRAGQWQQAMVNLQVALRHDPQNPLLRQKYRDVQQKLRG